MSANQNLRRAAELARDGDLKSALAEVKRALVLEPGHEKGLIFRFTLEARLLRRERRFGDAAVRYHAVLALDSENQEARHMLREHANRAPSSEAAATAQADPRPQAGVVPQSDAVPQVDSRSAKEAASAGGAGQAERASGADLRPSLRPTIPPPFEVADEGQELTDRPAALAPAQDDSWRSHSSAPPMVEIVSFRSERRVSAPGLRLSGVAIQQPAVTIQPQTPATAAAEEPAVPESKLADQEETENSDAMPDDLPPPSVETPLEPERRIARRVSIEVDVGVSSESNFFTGFSGDISEGGLFIATYNLVPIGSHVHVSFGVMGREISCDAIVCWIRDPIDVNLMPGFGVRFGELSDSDHAAIAKFIDARAPMFYDDD